MWHYISVASCGVVESDNLLPDASGSGVHAECLIDGALPGLGVGGLADMQGAPVLLPEGRGDPLRAFEDVPKAGPALLLALLAETPADGLNQLIGDDGDKEVAAGTLRGLVKDASQAKLGFERAEHGLHIGEGAVGAPQRFLVPVPDVRAQAVDAGMGEQGALERPAK